MNSFRAKAPLTAGRVVADRSFVVQLHRALPAESSEPVSGRVENVATGEHAYFESLQELDDFMRLTASRSR